MLVLLIRIYLSLNRFSHAGRIFHIVSALSFKIKIFNLNIYICILRPLMNNSNDNKSSLLVIDVVILKAHTQAEIIKK